MPGSFCDGFRREMIEMWQGWMDMELEELMN
jgi:hypothetical protein